jgi:hypothetical protein
MDSANKSKETLQYARKQAQIIRQLAAAARAKVSHRGGTWWDVECNGKRWLIRGASNVIQRLQVLAIEQATSTGAFGNPRGLHLSVH